MDWNRICADLILSIVLSNVALYQHKPTVANLIDGASHARWVGGLGVRVTLQCGARRRRFVRINRIQAKVTYISGSSLARDNVLVVDDVVVDKRRSCCLC